jgi:hypothetical protein
MKVKINTTRRFHSISLYFSLKMTSIWWINEEDYVQGSKKSKHVLNIYFLNMECNIIINIKEGLWRIIYHLNVAGLEDLLYLDLIFLGYFLIIKCTENSWVEPSLERQKVLYTQYCSQNRPFDELHVRNQKHVDQIFLQIPGAQGSRKTFTKVCLTESTVWKSFKIFIQPLGCQALFKYFIHMWYKITLYIYHYKLIIDI